MFKILNLAYACVFFLTITAKANYVGIVVSSSNGAVAAGVSVCNVTQSNCVITDATGSFSLPANAGDIVTFAHFNFYSAVVTVTASKLMQAELIKLDVKQTPLRTPQSPSSSWNGAKLGYNFDGFSDDENDFIGSAKVKLNMIKRKESALADYGVIGNISDFISKTNKEDADKDLQKLILSVNGLCLGLYGEWFIEKGKKGSKERSSSSFYATAGYRLNTYKYVTKDSITINLSQFKTSVGFQFEGFKFSESPNDNLNFSIEASLSAFDPNRYQKIFNEKKSVIVSVEIGTIIPIKEKIGFFVSGTFSPKVKGVFLAGIILKP